MTDIESEGNSTLKRDKRGRVRSTPEQRQAVLEQYGRSGLSGPEFARVAGIAYQTLAYWRHQSRKAALALRCNAVGSQEDGGASVRLVEAVLASPGPATGALVCPVGSVAVLHLELPGRATLRVSEAAQVPLAARLLQALAEPC